MSLLARSALLTAVLVMASAVPAAAHADPTTITPAPCASVDSVDAVEMQFTEELSIDGSRLELFVDGELIASAGPDLSDLDRASMVAALPSGITGVVEVEWTSVSVIDDDAVSGGYAFAIGGSIEGVDCDGVDQTESGGSASLVVILGLTAVVVVGVIGVARRPSHVEA